MPDQQDPPDADDPDADDPVADDPDADDPDADDSVADDGAAPEGDDVERDPAPLTRDDLQGSEPRVVSGRVGPVILGTVALLLVGFIVGRVTADEDGTAEEPTLSTLPPVTFPAGDQDRSGYWAFGGVRPALADAFDDDDPDGLGEADSGEPWEVVSGRWRVEGGTAAAEASRRSRPSLAVISGGPAERLTEATVTVVEEGAGIVFRYRDEDDHWSMTASPSSGIWTVTKVVDGEATVAAEIPGATVDGTTITVAQRGPELQVLVDGIEAIRITDTALQDQRRSGLITAPGSDGTARFDRFYIGSMPVR